MPGWLNRVESFPVSERFKKTLSVLVALAEQVPRIQRVKFRSFRVHSNNFLPQLPQAFDELLVIYSGHVDRGVQPLRERFFLALLGLKVRVHQNLNRLKAFVGSCGFFTDPTLLGVVCKTCLQGVLPHLGLHRYGFFCWAGVYRRLWFFGDV